MARARNIKPGFFRNADLVELPMEARLLFIGLWTLADREGRMEDRPKQIKIEIFPADNVDCDALLNDLAKTGMVARYEIDGKRYLQVTNFIKHQNPHRDEKASTVPDMSGNIAIPEAPTKKHRVSTVQTPCNEGASTVVIGLNPDPRSLIPDPLTEPNGSVARADQNPSPQSVVDLFHEVLPELPKVRILDDKRKRSISNFCKWVLTSKRTDGVRRAQTTNEAVDWIRSYFDRARDNDFLMGRGPKSPGHERWECDIDFLLSDKGKKFVIEKTREAA